MRGKRRLLGVLVALAATVLAAPSAAMACPGDGGSAPAEIKNHFCGTWNAAESRGLNPGTPLNNAFRFGSGWWRDFDGGAFGRGAIVEGDGVGFAYVVGQPWFNTYTGLGGPNSPLGYPVGRAEFGGHINNGARENKYMTFQGGVMNSWAGGTFATWGAINTKWGQLGNVSGPVGRPLSNEQQTARVNGRYSVFEGGNIIYNPRIDVASLVYGGILNKYGQLGYSNHPLGLPTGDRQYNAFKGNEYQVFDGGVINQYGGRAFATYGALLAKWQALGGANGPVGLPTSDEQQTARVPGRYATFQGGNLIFDSRTGQTYHVYGGILNKYAQLGYSNHPLGLPTSDRRRGPVGNDYQTFQGGVINQYGGRAFETHGEILKRWQRGGGPTGALGLPTSDERRAAASPYGTTGAYSRFQKGLINSSRKGTHVLFGSIGEKFARMGYSRSYLGFPTSEEFDADRGKRQNFEGGFILYKRGVGARTNRELGQPVRRPPRPYVVRAFGDSVAAGFGFNRTREDILTRCRPRLPTTRCDSPFSTYSRDVARALGRAKRRPVNYSNFAVAGSRPYDWLVGDDSRNGKADLYDLRPRLERIINAQPDLIMLTLGANDLLSDPFCTVAPSCVQKATRNTQAELRVILTRLRNRTSATIVVTTYYELESDFSGAIASLNKSIERAASSLGSRVRVAHVPSFKGHRCKNRSGGTWMLGASWDLCLHPNRLGHDQFARAVLRTLR